MSDLVDRLVDAVVDREHAQTAYRRSSQREFDEARSAVEAQIAINAELVAALEPFVVHAGKPPYASPHIEQARAAIAKSKGETA